MLNKKLIIWIRKQKLINKIKVRRKNKDQLKQWKFDDNSIYHISKNFFLIRPFIFKQNKKKWYQPLIIQKEEGVLGIIKKKISNENYYLLQAKAEPGNINSIQISPTVQATRSNYLRKHGGKKTLFLNYFLKKNKSVNILSNIKLSEQGTRFLGKKNKNLLVELKNGILNKPSNFIWLTKKNIKFLLGKRNLLQMDTISILSSIICKNKIDNSINDFKFLIFKLNYFSKILKLDRKFITFSKLKGWKIRDSIIFDTKKIFFSIFFIDVRANKREVKNWDQPFISDHSTSLNCFMISEIDKTNHYLLKIVHEPGFDAPKFTSTISEKNFSMKKFKKNIFLRLMQIS